MREVATAYIMTNGTLPDWPVAKAQYTSYSHDRDAPAFPPDGFYGTAIADSASERKALANNLVAKYDAVFGDANSGPSAARFLDSTYVSDLLAGTQNASESSGYLYDDFGADVSAFTTNPTCEQVAQLLANIQQNLQTVEYLAVGGLGTIESTQIVGGTGQGSGDCAAAYPAAVADAIDSWGPFEQSGSGCANNATVPGAYQTNNSGGGGMTVKLYKVAQSIQFNTRGNFPRIGGTVSLYSKVKHTCSPDGWPGGAPAPVGDGTQAYQLIASATMGNSTSVTIVDAEPVSPSPQDCDDPDWRDNNYFGFGWEVNYGPAGLLTMVWDATDGLQYEIPEFTSDAGEVNDLGAMFGLAEGEPGEGNLDLDCGGGNPETGSPVSLSSGTKSERAVDVVVPLAGADFRFIREHTSELAYIAQGDAYTAGNTNIGVGNLVGNGWDATAFRGLSFDDPEDPEVITVHGVPLREHLEFYLVPGSSPSEWKPNGPTTQVITKETAVISGESQKVWRLEEPGEWQLDFYWTRVPGETSADDYLNGLLLQERDMHDNVHTFQYYTDLDTTGNTRPAAIFLNGSPGSFTTEAVIVFDWHLGDGDPLNGKLKSLEVQRRDTSNPSDPNVWFATQRVEYTYAEDVTSGSADLGSGADLVQVRKSILTDKFPPNLNDDLFWHSITQYRYHDANTPPPDSDDRLEVDGTTGQLKYVINPEQIEYYAQRWNADIGGVAADLALDTAAARLLTLDDDAVVFEDDAATNRKTVDLAAKILDYSGDQVAEQYLQSACGCAGATQGTKLVYTYYTRNDGQLDYATTRVQEYTLDGSGDYTVLHKTTYHDLYRPSGLANGVLYMQSRAVDQGTRRWVTAWDHDIDGNVLRVYSPAALGSYTSVDEHTGPASYTPGTAGRVEEFTYNADNRVLTRAISENGTTGPFDLIERYSYYEDDNPAWETYRDHLLGKVERFTNAQSTGDEALIETTTYDYVFRPLGETESDSKIAAMQTRVEAELVSENGDSDITSYDTVDLFDGNGQLRWRRNADNSLTYFEYGAGHGEVVKVVQNANRQGESQGGSEINPAFEPGKYLASGLKTVHVPSWGTHANGGSLATSTERDALGRAISVTLPDGTASYVSRETRLITERPDLTYYAEVSLPFMLPTTQTFDGLATVTVYNAAGRPILQSRHEVTSPGTYDPPSTYALAAQAAGLSVTDHSLSGLVESVRAWHDASDSTAVYMTAFEYDDLGRLTTTTSSNGTLTTMDYDVMDRVIKTQVDVPGGQGAVTVSEFFYDHTGSSGNPSQGEGNGNLTLVRRSTGEGPLGSDARVTVRRFDARDRLYSVENPLAPHEFLVYDNLDRVVSRSLYSEAPTSPDTPPDASKRGLYETTSYSQRGLVYRTRQAVDPTDDVTTTYLASDVWYDGRAREVASVPPGTAISKTAYDGLGRVTSVYVTDSIGTDARQVTSDTVLEQTDYRYTTTDRVDLVTAYVRSHGSTVTGPLSGHVGTGDAIRSYSGTIYDEAARPRKQVEYGTNSLSDVFETGDVVTVVDDASIPAHALVSEMAYGVRGLVETTIDPEDAATKIVYDDLDRVVATIENYVDAAVGRVLGAWEVTGGVGNDEHDSDRVTILEYDGSGHVVEQHAYVPNGTSVDVQTTEYIYGVTAAATNTDPADSLLDSNDLLQEIRYPNETTGQPGTTNDYKVRFAYNQLGELRSIIDQNLTMHEYYRDNRGRVVRDAVTVDSGSGVDDAIRSIVTTYDDFGRTDQIRSASDHAGTSIENDVRLRYTPLWQVAKVYQDPQGAITTVDSQDPDSAPTGSSRWVRYAYDNSPDSASNRSRLSSLTYPDGKVLDYEYGVANGTDDRISRVASMSLDTVGIAEYHRIGVTGLAALNLNALDVQLDRTASVDGKRRLLAHNDQAKGVYPGLDRFARPALQSWVDGNYDYSGSGTLPNLPPILQEEYAYDDVSSLTAKYDSRPGGSQGNRDHELAYDGLHRLEAADRGVRDGVNWTHGLRGQDWTLDALGNWTSVGTDLNGNGATTDSQELDNRTHNLANEIVQRQIPGLAGGALTHTNDDAGNLTQSKKSGIINDHFVYDAWNRLVLIREVWNVIPQPPGDQVAHYTYNGLHWRIVEERDAVSTGMLPDGTLDQQRIYYYSANWQLLQEDIDDDFDPNDPNDLTVDRRSQQVWGIRSIDDGILRRLDRDLDLDYDDTYYYISDALGSSRALLDAGGNLVERIVYDAYGWGTHRWAGDIDGDGDALADDKAILDALAAGSGTPISDTANYRVECDLNFSGTIDSADQALWTSWGNKSALALKGGPITDPAGPDNPVGFAGYLYGGKRAPWYLARHRSYDPTLGRWLARDPAGYVDGTNLYLYAGNRPLNTLDPFGLQGSAIDEAVADNLAFQNQVMSDFRAGRISGESASKLLNSAQERATERIATAERITNSFSNKLNAGLKANANATIDAVAGFATLGFVDDLDVFSVNSYERGAGYGVAYGVGRMSSEIGVGLATGGASTMGWAGKGVMAIDAAGNLIGAGRGVVDAVECGLSWQNGVQIVAGAAGMGGNSTGALGRWPLPRVRNVDPGGLRFSQTTAGGGGRAARLRASMAANGWDGPPVDVVRMRGGRVTLDNTRLAVAQELGLTQIPARVHRSGSRLPLNMVREERFGQNARTWGDAVRYRTSHQRPYLPASGTDVPPRMPRN